MTQKEKPLQASDRDVALGMFSGSTWCSIVADEELHRNWKIKPGEVNGIGSIGS